MKIGDKINYLEIIDGPERWRDAKNRPYLVFKCKCHGKCNGFEKWIRKADLLKGRQSCGCMCGKTRNKINGKVDLIGQTVKCLTILSNSLRCKNKYFYLCRCNVCEKLKFIPQSNLYNKNVKSCGCTNLNQNRKKLEGQKIGVLRIQKYLGWSKRNGGKYECKCDCGRVCVKQYTELKIRIPVTCGECNLYLNGHKISSPQKNLHNLLGRGILNYRVGRRTIDIALAYKNKKIAIEYDYAAWHIKEKDEIKTKELLDKNWYLIRIRSAHKIPSIEQIYEKLDNLTNNNKIEYIELNDWDRKRYTINNGE